MDNRVAFYISTFHNNIELHVCLCVLCVSWHLISLDNNISRQKRKKDRRTQTQRTVEVVAVQVWSAGGDGSCFLFLLSDDNTIDREKNNWRFFFHVPNDVAVLIRFNDTLPYTRKGKKK